MICNPFQVNASPAVKRYTAGMFFTMLAYLVCVFATTTVAHRYHPHGPAVYLLSAIPSACILAMLGVVAIYLRDEKDEYQRMLFVRSLLWATFATLAIAAYSDFLRSYGDLPALPPFVEFVAFWMVFGVVQGVQSVGGSRASHE